MSKMQFYVVRNFRAAFWTPQAAKVAECVEISDWSRLRNREQRSLEAWLKGRSGERDDCLLQKWK